ncbi:MAG TPA: hopanoid C-3 methylase HpnR [Candidatus Binataceae bacterium]|jgi:hopanoid C-3 methylase HpnR|nr:hopanoid C-3 methylase HpnR [Candidatus Binataceae bacterium]
MRVLFVHPSPLMYSELYLRLEPLGLERVAAAVLEVGHDVRMIDLQIFNHRDYFRELEDFKPQAIGFSLNYLANVPEVVDLAKATRELRRDCFIFAGGHSGSFVASDVLEHAQGAIDCIVRGEGETVTQQLLEAIGGGNIDKLPGIVTAQGAGAPPKLIDDLDRFMPARHLGRRRNKYFIGELDPCASIEFTRGCPWDCSFCSAWTFYGRSYRKSTAEAAAEDMASIKEPNVFIVDDVAFIHPEHGFAIGHELEKRNIKKRYYLETRSDVLCRNEEVFAYWRRLGLEYMFLGLEAIDEEGLKAHRKRSSTGVNSKALEVARKIGVTVAINLIADPDWDERRFEVVREWALSIPEIVHLTVATPYPGTETWFTESRKLTTRDYRLFDIQHAVLPTRLPLDKYYEELVKTQSIINRKHMGLGIIKDVAFLVAKLALQGQTNFAKMLWKFNKVYNPKRQYSDHFQEIKYQIRLPEQTGRRPPGDAMYIHAPKVGRAGAASATAAQE